MLNEPPKHLADKYRLYAIWLENDYGSRPVSDMLLVHVARPLSFATFCESYIFQHLELTVVKTGVKIKTSGICGVQKVDNQNTPKYEITMDGNLKEIL